MSVVSSLPLDLAGEQCPLCLDPLSEFIDLTQRQCKHIVCTACFHAGEKASGYCNNACPVCRVPCVASTRNSASLVTHFPATKQLMTVPKEKPKETSSAGHAPQGPTPRRVAPSSSGAGREKRKEKSERLMERKAKKAKEKAAADDGGFALMARGEAREQGVSIPAGSQRTCLPDAMWAAMKSLLPHTKLSLKEVRKSLPPSPDQADPNISMAKRFAAGYRIQIKYDRQLNNPKALFDRRIGVFLVLLRIETSAGLDQHFVTYLAETGHVIDNELRSKVPIIEESDRSTNPCALKVFSQLFPRAESIFIKSVFELKRQLPASPQFRKLAANHPTDLPFSPCEPPAPGCPPTLDQLFLEFYPPIKVRKLF